MHTKHSIQSRFTQEQLTPFGPDGALTRSFTHFTHSSNLPDGNLSRPVLLFAGAQHADPHRRH